MEALLYLVAEWPAKPSLAPETQFQPLGPSFGLCSLVKASGAKLWPREPYIDLWRQFMPRFGSLNLDLVD